MILEKKMLFEREYEVQKNVNRKIDLPRIIFKTLAQQMIHSSFDCQHDFQDYFAKPIYNWASENFS